MSPEAGGRGDDSQEVLLIDEGGAERGFVAVDMETGLLAGRNLRVATIRVVLDSSDRGISGAWLSPASAALRPRLWRELFWLCRVAPSYALCAARILKAGLKQLPCDAFFHA